MPVRCSLKEGDMIKGVRGKRGIPVQHSFSVQVVTQALFNFNTTFSTTGFL